MVEHFHRYRLSLAVDVCGHVRIAETARLAVGLEVGVEVPGYSYMGCGIHAVRGDFVLDYGLGLEMKEFLGGSSGNGILGKYHYALV